MRIRTVVAAFALGASFAVAASDVQASSHREAPFNTKNPKVDGTDFYMFRSYEGGRDAFVTLIANYQPLQGNYGGPNFFTMDPEALYEIHIDNTGDAVEDITFQFRFQNALSNGGKGTELDIGASGATKKVAISLVNSGPTDETNKNLNVLETYTIKYVKGDRRTGMASDVTDAANNKTFTKPVDNIGSKSVPNYETYARSFLKDIKIPDCTTNGKVFVGQRQEGFAVNLGPVFDLINAPASVVTGDPAAGGANPIGDKNVTTLALEVPIACLKGAGTGVIGAWTTASVRQARIINPKGGNYTNPTREGGAWTQVSRLGMALVNEVVIGLRDKDRFNATKPKDDGANFADYITNPTFPALVELLFGSTVAAPKVFPRVDLLAVFATGVEGVNQIKASPAVGEMLRLNTAFPVKAASEQFFLGAAGCFKDGAGTLKDLDPALASCDPNGYPNGRRPGDDVVDITLRVAQGYLFSKDSDAPARGVPLTDAIKQSATDFDSVFPYLKTPNGGS